MSETSAAPVLRTDAALDVIPTSTLITVGVAILIVYLSTIGLFPMSEPDEARYAQIPREMLTRGDWITPYLNHVKYFEKPPLLYWAVAATYSLLGFHELTARLWPVLFALLGMGITYAVGRSMWNRWVGAVAAAILATCPLYFGLSQVLSLDMMLAALITAAAGSFWFAYADDKRRRVGLLAFYASLALAVLTKGPVALVLLGGIVGAFVLLRRDFAVLRWLLAPMGIVLFLAIAAPWHIAVTQANPEFAQFYVVEQHLNRYLNPHEHHEPIWFFVPVVFGGAAPWTVLCLTAPSLLWSRFTALLRGRTSASTLYLALWAGVIFLFFSLSGSKLATYIVPVFPPLALLMARALQIGLRKDPARRLWGGSVTIAAFGAAMLGAALIVAELVDDRNGSVIASRLALAGAPVLLAGYQAAQQTRRGRPVTALAWITVATLVLQLATISGRSLAPSYEKLADAIRERAHGADFVVTYGHVTHSIPLYSGQRTVLVGNRSELEFGSRQGDHSDYFWDSADELPRRWASGLRLLVVINRIELESIQDRLQPPPRVIAGQGKKVVVVNFDG